MNISSYNVTDVSYHYLGLRVLDAMPDSATRTEQIENVARNVHKFVGDRNRRLMVAAPGTSFKGTGGKICQELAHFHFVKSYGKADGYRYYLTKSGRHVVDLLAAQNGVELRRLMAQTHLQTYENLRNVVQNHITVGPVWRPIEVKADLLKQDNYLQNLLEPTFGSEAGAIASKIRVEYCAESPSRIRDALHSRTIEKFLPNQRMGVANFRGMCARLATLRLLNLRRATANGHDFYKTYSPCLVGTSSHYWYTPLDVPLPNGETYHLLFCEPDMADQANQGILLDAIDTALTWLSPISGYYDIPDVRDEVCEALRIPEAAFDDGLNRLLDHTPSPLSVGLHYDGISAHRKPLVRHQTNQLHNLIRRV